APQVDPCIHFSHRTPPFCSAIVTIRVYSRGVRLLLIHFLSRCYHPLFCFNQFGDCEGAVLRPGNVHSADNWRGLLGPIVERHRAAGKKLYFRADAAFASPDIYEYLEEKKALYAMRIKSNSRLAEEIEHLTVRPPGRPSAKPKVYFHSFSYRAKTWRRSRRVVAKIEWHQGELFPRTGFIVTNLKRKPEKVVRFYNQRARCENHIKEGKHTLAWTRLSCTRYVCNQVRLALFVLAYNLCNFLRRFALPSRVSHWSLSSVQLKLIKIGAKVISHSRKTVFQMAEVAVPGELFAEVLACIRSLAAAPT
ncbi:MAG: IS1380 family transposase, partial [Actinomycetota bacterium]|nr:IS1380 family transposase [Actinomycetota bacterium]